MAKAKTNPSLVEYLETYIENQAIKNRKLGYEEYKTLYRSDNDGAYHKAVTKLLEDAARRSARGSSTTESLSEMGLRTSGYADYLKSGMTPDIKKARDEEQRQRDYLEERAKNAYYGYSRNYDIHEEETRVAVGETLIDEGVYDPNLAYAYAVELGLSREAATKISQHVSAVTRARVSNEILKGLANKSMSLETAITLGVSYGMSLEELNKIKKLYSDIKEDPTKIPEEYLEYLESIADRMDGYIK